MDKNKTEIPLEELVFKDENVVDKGGNVVGIVPVGFPKRLNLRNSQKESFVNAFNKSLTYKDKNADYYMKGPTTSWTEEIDRFTSRTYYNCLVQLYRKSE